MPVNLADFTFIQYPAREQAELRVRIKIPGVWFQGLSGAERSVKYEAEAYDFVDAHVFKKNGKARLLAQKAPLAELQAVLRDSASSGRGDARGPLGLNASDRSVFEARLAAEVARPAGPLDAYNQDQEEEKPFDIQEEMEKAVDEFAAEQIVKDEGAAAQGAAASSSSDAPAPVASES